MAQISQPAASNRFHEAEQRLARRLLMTRDRVGSDEFLLTNVFLAHMLGLGREGVTNAANSLVIIAGSSKYRMSNDSRPRLARVTRL
jgi:CRP-like cAMP-binding protein